MQPRQGSPTQRITVALACVLLVIFYFQDLEFLKRDYKNLQNDCDGLKEQMAIKDQLLQVSLIAHYCVKTSMICFSQHCFNI